MNKEMEKYLEEHLERIFKLNDLFEILEEEQKIIHDPHWDEEQRTAIFIEYSKRVNEHFANLSVSPRLRSEEE